MRDRVERVDDNNWVTLRQASDGGDRWRTIEEYQWPFPFAPIDHAKNLPLANSMWGLSDIDSVRLNDTLNKTSSDMNKILHFHGSPQYTAFGINLGDLNSVEMGAGTIFHTDRPKSEVDIGILEMSGDLGAARQYRQELIQSMHETNGSTFFDATTMNAGQLSGFAIRLMFSNLLATTDVKRAQYGAMLKRLSYRGVGRCR